MQNQFLLTLKIAAVSVLLTAAYINIFSQPLRLTLADDGTPVLRICELDMDGTAANKRVHEYLQEINEWMDGSLRILITKKDDACDITLLLSPQYPFSGRSGLDYHGHPITQANPVLLDESTLWDEFGHQLQGHSSVPHAGAFIDEVINAYMDESNQLFWIGLRSGLINVPQRTAGHDCKQAEELGISHGAILPLFKKFPQFWRPEEAAIPMQPWAEVLYREHNSICGIGRPVENCLPYGIPRRHRWSTIFKIVQYPSLTLTPYEEFARFRPYFHRWTEPSQGYEPGMTWAFGPDVCHYRLLHARAD
jgi:hypothetical protein